MSTAETQTKTKFEVTSLDALESYPQQEGRLRLQVRSNLGIQAFGVNAYGAEKEGVTVINEHHEANSWSSSKEELYLVAAGHAAFTVDGEEIDAPAGTLVFVADPKAKRSAVAMEPATHVIAVGATPGEPYRISPAEAAQGWYAHYQDKEYEQGKEILEATLVDYPDHPFLLYNIACCESLLGRKEEALEHLRPSLAADEGLRELAVDDRDLDPVRDDPRFEKMIT